MLVDLFVNCPWATDTDCIRQTLNLYLRNDPCDTPVGWIDIKRHHSCKNTTARFRVKLNEKVVYVLGLINVHMGVTLVHKYKNGGSHTIWSLHHPDRLPKKN
jgi:hypothetical protein